MKYFQLSFKCLLTFLIMRYVFSILDFHLLWAGAQKISIQVLMFAGLFCFCCSLCQAIRWGYMNTLNFTYAILFPALTFWKAGLFNLITPASVGGDIYRVIATSKNKTSSSTFALIIKERFLGLMGLCVCYLLFLSIYFIKDPTMPKLFLASGMVCIAGLTSLTILQKSLPFLVRVSAKNLNRKWKKKVIHFAKAFHYNSKKEFLVLFSITIISFIGWVLAYYMLAQSIFPSIEIEKLGLVSLITELARWIPITIQGVGIREGVAAYAFKTLTYPVEVGFLIAGLIYCINTLVIIILGSISFAITSSALYLSKEPMLLHT